MHRLEIKPMHRANSPSSSSSQINIIPSTKHNQYHPNTIAKNVQTQSQKDYNHCNPTASHRRVVDLTVPTITVASGGEEAAPTVAERRTVITEDLACPPSI
jgi:hypothetical protein